MLPTVAPYLSYDGLGDVEDGTAAQAASEGAISEGTAPWRRGAIERELLAYGALDTLAMVELVRFLSRPKPFAFGVLESFSRGDIALCHADLRKCYFRAFSTSKRFNEEIAMRSSMFSLGLFLAGSLAANVSAADARQMSFFITSTGPGNGANLGGLEGADRHCQKLANAAGAGNKIWRAYLSTQGKDFKDPNVVNARDRIGSGPWYNAKGVLIANNVDELHSPENNLNKETALDENGKMVNGRTEKPNTHDILTGSRLDGTSFGPRFFADMTCGDWTSNEEGAAMLGHHDRVGPNDNAWTKSWNSSHLSKGCSAEALKKTGGNGLFYCFAER